MNVALKWKYSKYWMNEFNAGLIAFVTLLWSLGVCMLPSLSYAEGQKVGILLNLNWILVWNPDNKIMFHSICNINQMPI